MTLPDIDRLRAAGWHDAEAARKRALFERVADGFRRLAGTSRDLHFSWTPGRIEFLGKHTDYAGGRSLLCAVDRGFAFAASPRADDTLRVQDAGFGGGDTIQFPLHPDLEPPRGHWATYAMTLGRRIARNFAPPLRGADIAFASDLPMAAGMSSSSALTVGLFLALADATGLRERDEYRSHLATVERLAEYLGSIESGLSVPGMRGDRGVGTLSGCEDQTAILAGRADSLIRASFVPVCIDQTLPLPEGHAFIIASSGIVAEKTGAALELYNGVSRKAAAVLEVWRAATNRDDVSLARAVQSSPDAPAQLREILRRTRDARYSSKELLDRFEQFYAESEEIIPDASDALLYGDTARLGVLVDQSQAGVERLLGNQIAETIFLARSARELGAVAASAFGAGFGGSVWALIPDGNAPEFVARWRDAYLAAFPQHNEGSEFFVTSAGPAALALG